VRGRDVQAQLLHQSGEPWRLALGQLEDQSREARGVDDRVLERAFEAAAHEPGVKRVVAVLDQNRALREAKKRPARIPELRCADQHRAVDVMSPLRVRVDGGAAVDQRVEERERTIQLESFGPHLEDEEWRISCRLHVECDELRVFEPRARAQFRRIDRDLLPRHRFRGAAGLEQDRPFGHLASASALRANAISSVVTARSSRAAPA
jgi:hypothetical protein